MQYCSNDTYSYIVTLKPHPQLHSDRQATPTYAGHHRGTSIGTVVIDILYCLWACWTNSFSTDKEINISVHITLFQTLTSALTSLEWGGVIVMIIVHCKTVKIYFLSTHIRLISGMEFFWAANFDCPCWERQHFRARNTPHPHTPSPHHHTPTHTHTHTKHTHTHTTLTESTSTVHFDKRLVYVHFWWRRYAIRCSSSSWNCCKQRVKIIRQWKG